MAQQSEILEQQQHQTSTQLKKQRRPIIDVLVGFFAIPLLIFCALKLEQHMNNNWESATDTRWMVFALGICMLVISLIIIAYVTHRLGVCLWAGPLEGVPSVPGNSTPYNNYVDTAPPSYETVMKFDIPPPPYECVVINIEDIVGVHKNSKAKSSASIVNKKML